MILIKRLAPYEYFDIRRINQLLEQQSPNGSHHTIDHDEIRGVLENPLIHIFVATDTDSTNPNGYVGMATIFFQRNLARWISEIHDVVVDESQRGKGIGKSLTEKLMETALRFSVEKGVKIKLYLTSRPSRVVANRLYQKLGFVLVSKSCGDWGTNLYKIIVEPSGFRGLP